MKSNKILKLLLIIFIAISLILGTIVVFMFASGGTFTNDGIITNTGKIKFEVLPKEIKYTVYVNGEKKEIFDKQIGGLIEGEYMVKIEAENYLSWEKNIIVYKGVVTDVIARLYPNELEITQVTNSNIQKIVFADNGEYAYYVISEAEFGTEKGIWRIQLNDSTFLFSSSLPEPQRILNIIPEISDAIESNNYQLIPSPDNSKLLFKDLENNKLFIINTNELSDKTYQNITSNASVFPDTVKWLSNSNGLVFSNKEIIFEYNLNDKILTLIKYSPDSPISFASNSNQIIVLINNQFHLYKDKKLALLEIPNLNLPNDIISIYSTPKDDVFFLKSISLGMLYLNTRKVYLKQVSAEQLDLEFVQVNNEASAAIFQDKNGNYYTFTAIENLGLNRIDNTLSILKDISGPSSLNFSSTSLHIIYLQKNNEGNNDVYTVDKDGNNKYLLLENVGLESSVQFSANGNYLYLLMSDTTSTGKVNLFRVKLIK